MKVYYLILAAALVLSLELILAKDWADHWCEINDCKGEKSAAKDQAVVDTREKELRIATRRYHATGEIRAMKSEAVQHAYWQYDGPTLDHPAFPGVAEEHATRKEIQNERAAVEMRRETAARAALGSDFRPGGGFLPPGSPDSNALMAADEIHPAVMVAKTKYKHMTEEVRIPCQYDMGKEPGRLHTHTTMGSGSPNGCAAGSVWQAGRDGKFFNDPTKLLHRTNEHKASVWKKTNGTHREWFEDIYQLKDGEYGPQSKQQIEARRLLPYKMGAPPPCAPGYGGAGCKRELGAGAEYVDEEDTIPPWAPRESVEKLVKFWKKEIKDNARIAGASQDPKAIAGGAYAQAKKKKKKKKEQLKALGGAAPEDGDKDDEQAKEGDKATEEKKREEQEAEQDKKEDLATKVTGIELIPYEVASEGETAMEVLGNEDNWQPNSLGSAHGPWYGGWWMGVYGQNLGKKASELKGISIGDVRCKREIWLSETSAACMVPMGMGLEQTISVETKEAGIGYLEGKFTYDPPEIFSYHPRNGAVRGGTMVTVFGKNFGHVDTSPVAYLAGRLCIETFWVADHTVICRSPPGAGGHTHLHHIDVIVHEAPHVQDMPRRLKNFARGIKAVLKETVQAQPDLVLELDATANGEKKRKEQEASKDLAIKSEMLEQQVAEVGKDLPPEERKKAQQVAKQKMLWNMKEQETMQKLPQIKAEKESQANAAMLEYLETSVERDNKEYERKLAKREAIRQEREKKEQDLKRQRDEEEQALKTRHEKLVKQKTVAEEKTKKNLEKFKEAQRRAQHAKARKQIDVALKSDSYDVQIEAMLFAKDAELPITDKTVQQIRAKLGLEAEEQEGEYKRFKRELEQKQKEREKAEKERVEKEKQAQREQKKAEEKAAAQNSDTEQNSDTIPANDDEEDLPDLDLYEGKKKKVKKVVKKVKKKKAEL